MQLQPTYYTWKSEASNPQLRLGLIAQNVQTQFPEMVSDDGSGYLSLDYSAMVSPLIGAVQEQQAQISGVNTAVANLGGSISSLNTTVASLQASNLTNGGNINGSLSIAGNLTVGGTITVAQNATFNQNVVIAGELHTADIYVGGHIVTVGSAPVVTLGGGVGSADPLASVDAPQVTIEGNDTSGTVSVKVGANTSADKLFDLAFSKSFATKPRIIFSPANQKSSQVGAYYDAGSVTNDGFSLYAGSPPETGQVYTFTYYIVQ